MKRLNRQEAKQLGVNKCYGSACKTHPELEGFRLVSGACVECAKEYLKKSRRANPERTKAHYKIQNDKSKLNPLYVAKKRASAAAYRKANRAKISVVEAAWRAENPDKVLIHKQNAKGKYKAQKNFDTAMRRVSLYKRTPTWLSVDDRWIIEQAYELATLRTKMFGFLWHVDHIIPLRGKTVSGLHVPWNIQVIPAIENLRKSNKFTGVAL